MQTALLDKYRVQRVRQGYLLCRRPAWNKLNISPTFATNHITHFYRHQVW